MLNKTESKTKLEVQIPTIPEANFGNANLSDISPYDSPDRSSLRKQSVTQRKVNVVHLTSENFPTKFQSRNDQESPKSNHEDGIDNKLSEYSNDDFQEENYDETVDKKNSLQTHLNTITLSGIKTYSTNIFYTL